MRGEALESLTAEHLRMPGFRREKKLVMAVCARWALASRFAQKTARKEGDQHMAALQVNTNLTIEQTQVARYHAFEETADGFALPGPTSSDRHFRFSLPGAIALPAVIYYRTRHTGRPAFSVRINDAKVTQYTFVDGDEAERTWHEVIPASTAAGPTLHPDNNELVFFARDGSVVFGDVVILYTSSQTTVSIPIVVTLAQR